MNIENEQSEEDASSNITNWPIIPNEMRRFLNSVRSSSRILSGIFRRIQQDANSSDSEEDNNQPPTVFSYSKDHVHLHRLTDAIPSSEKTQCFLFNN